MATAKDAYRTAMREDLVAAAERVVARKGVQGLTIRDILAEAGVAPGTLYTYFAGKEELLEAMAQRALGQYVAAVTAGGGSSPEDAFGMLVRSVFTQPMEGASLLADMRGRPGDSDQAAVVRRFNEDLVASMRPLVERLRDSGALVTDDGDALLELLDVIWDGMTRRSAAGTFVTSYERVGGLAVDLLAAAGLLPPDETPRPDPPPTPRSRR